MLCIELLDSISNDPEARGSLRLCSEDPISQCIAKLGGGIAYFTWFVVKYFSDGAGKARGGNCLQHSGYSLIKVFLSSFWGICPSTSSHCISESSLFFVGRRKRSMFFFPLPEVVEEKRNVWNMAMLVGSLAFDVFRNLCCKF